MKLEKINFENLSLETRRSFANTLAQNKVRTPPGQTPVQYGARRMRRALAKMNRKKK